MEVTRDVIVDLLPAYFAGEASEQTQRLIEAYFERDPEFAQLARRMNDKLIQAVPVRLSPNHEMKALQRARGRVLLAVLGLAAILSCSALAILAFFTLQVGF